MIGGLETLGLVGEGNGRVFAAKATPRKKMKGETREERRVVSSVSEEEVEGCLEGVGGAILRGLLMGEQ